MPENQPTADEVIGFTELSDEARMRIVSELDPERRVAMVLQLTWHWADFHLYINSPTMPIITPFRLIEPETLESGEKEFVYTIQDHGYKLSTSKAQEMYTAGMSNCKLFYTIEKMIAILVERLKTSGTEQETEVQVAFAGHLLPQRKAFEVIINLPYNVVVVNFDPEAWGEDYLETVKRMGEKYGYPPEAPRDVYRQSYTSGKSGIRR